MSGRFRFNKPRDRISVDANSPAPPLARPAFTFRQHLAATPESKRDTMTKPQAIQTDPDPFADRRVHPRVMVALPAFLQANGARHSVQILDLSSGGAKLTCPASRDRIDRLLDCGSLAAPESSAGIWRQAASPRTGTRPPRGRRPDGTLKGPRHANEEARVGGATSGIENARCPL